MPKFQSRHYRAIADVIAAIPVDLFSQPELDRLIAALIVAFERDNPAFKPDRFVSACKR